MPFKDKSAMKQRLEFVRLASAEGANVSALCRRFGIGRTCGHKLLLRYRSEGEAGLAEQSRRPRSSPAQCAPEVETAALAVRAAHP
ncbi:leucine-zipper of insertion element IS481, partial [Mesorhizobium muleiense]